MKKRISYLFISFFLMVSLVWAAPPQPPVPAASETQAGKVELATDAETVTGTSDAVVCTPGNIAAKMAAPGAIGGTTPAAGEFTILKNTGKVHHVLAAGSPMLIGGDDIATLTGVTISNANPSVLTKDATIDDGLAVGDAVIVNSGTNATVGVYIVASIVANTSVTLDRQAATGACTDASVTYVNDAIIIETASGSGEPRIVLPLQNDASTPTLAFGDGDTGFYETADDYIRVSIAGGAKGDFDISGFHSITAFAPFMIWAAATGTTPGWTFYTDQDTGIGHAAADQLSLIAGGVEGIRISEDTTILINANGWLAMKEMAADPAALADHAFLYAKDVGGTGNMFVADAAADATQLSSHNFSMFDPDPAEKFPWSFYAENKALGVKINVDMARMVRAVEALTGQTFIHYADMEKSVDLEAAYKAQWEREYIEKNTYEEIVSKGEAFEMVEVDERVLYDVEVTDPKTGKIKIRKQGKQIGEKSTGFELVNNEVKEQIELIWETRKVMKAQLKENVRFETVDGKFYKKIVPTKAMAKAAAVEGFQFTPPAWMAEKLNASPEPM